MQKALAQDGHARKTRAREDLSGELLSGGGAKTIRIKMGCGTKAAQDWVPLQATADLLLLMVSRCCRASSAKVLARDGHIDRAKTCMPPSSGAMNATNPPRAGLTYTGKIMKLAISFTFRPLGFVVIGAIADGDHTLSVDGKWAFSRQDFRGDRNSTHASSAFRASGTSEMGWKPTPIGQ